MNWASEGRTATAVVRRVGGLTDLCAADAKISTRQRNTIVPMLARVDIGL